MTTTNNTTPATAEPTPATDPQEAPEMDGRRELVDVDPALLLVDGNIREAHLDKPFLASVKRHGVLVPIVAVRTPDGLRVRMGNRRTLAAVQTARPTVPVLVTGAEDDDHAARIVAQWTENEHRTALTNAERVEAVHQLSLYGLSAAQIATRTAAPKATVAAALTVAGNELAAKAAIRYEFLTLEQAATLTRYEQDTETVTALVAAAKLGPVQFDRVVAKADADAAEVAADQARRDRAAAALAEAGCPVIDQPQTGDGTARLSRLLDAATGHDLTPENHATCVGHAAWLDGDWEPVPEGEDDPDADDDGYRPTFVASGRAGAGGRAAPGPGRRARPGGSVPGDPGGDKGEHRPESGRARPRRCGRDRGRGSVTRPSRPCSRPASRPAHARPGPRSNTGAPHSRAGPSPPDAAARPRARPRPGAVSPSAHDRGG